MASSSSEIDQTGTSSQTHETEENNLLDYLPLYKAVLKGDLAAVERICSNHTNADRTTALEVSITVNGDTALHVAVGTGKENRVVDYLVDKMTTPQLELRNKDGDTALSIAAIVGNLEAAKKMVEKQSNLNRIKNNKEWVPLLEAARHGQKEMVLYFLEHTGDYLKAAEYVADKPIVLFMHFLIIAGFYDVALELVQSHPGLGKVELHKGESLLTAMAGKPSSFPSGRPLNFWQRVKYLFQPVKLLREINMRKQTLKLVKWLCEESTSLDYIKASSILERPLILGAQLGIEELVQEIITSFPHAIWFSDEENHNIFQLAVMNRQENIFNLIYDMGYYKRLLLGSQDTAGNNILHLAGKLAPQHRLNKIPGAALQMQCELQWFKEVEKIVQPSFKDDRNSEGKTPAMVFTEAHMDLVKEGEKWMKDTASSCTVVAALIATVVFAAAITFPGGNNNDNGQPIFAKTKMFIIFGISDALSLFSSIAAIIMFLSILTARYAEGDFLYALPKRLTFGLVTLFLSITSMMIAFSATLYLVFCSDKTRILIPVALSACLPVSLFVSLQFPLLVDMIYSTYGPGIFDRKSKEMSSLDGTGMLYTRVLPDRPGIL